MCIRTVEGDPGTLRTVQGTAGNETDGLCCAG